MLRALTRRKRNKESPSGSQLARVLTTWDLVALGVGSTLGVGIYVLAGQVAKDVAGPAVVISFMLAAFVTALAGLSYAEFGARVPKAGSAYIYSYYCVGEFPAFVIGWSLIMEYGIGAASVARAISSYIDTLLGGAISHTLSENLPLDHAFLSEYVDLFAMGVCLCLTFMLAFGVRESSIVNTIFTSTNLCIVAFFIIAGSFKADLENWLIPVEDIPPGVDGGKGGFVPFGIAGIVQGAAICFYGFIGFDCIATTGEEVHNPQKAIPTAIVVSLGVVLSCYLGVSTVITLIVPYYLQDPEAPIPHAFDMVGWHIAKWVISIGALFGLCSSLFGGLFPLPRIIYAMAQDGLLYKCLGRVHSRFLTPMVGTLVAGSLTAVIAAFFNLKQLVGLNAIGTLLTYVLVSICVLILRYEESPYDVKIKDALDLGEQTRLISTKSAPTCRDLWNHFWRFRRSPASTMLTFKLVVFNTLSFCVLSAVLSTILVIFGAQIQKFSPPLIILVSAMAICMLLLVFSIAIQPSSKQHLSFKMPLVPYAPCLSIFIDVYLMAVMDFHTWVRFGACMLLGFTIYFSYGIWNSLEKNSLHENHKEKNCPDPFQ